jgi:putative ABC transport system permease protein
MFTNDVKIAFRNLLKHKGYSFINIFGLGLGIAVCFLISLWVRDELRYDRFHAKAGRIYRALWEARYGDNEWKIPVVPAPLAETLEREFPEVESMVRFHPGGLTLLLGEDYIREPDVLFAEESFFDVFSVALIAGDSKTALRDPDAVVLTEENARRYFPNEEALGRTIRQNDGRLLRVAGVVKAFPPQSHFHFGFLASIENLNRFTSRRQQWGSASVYTYLALRPGENAAALQAKLQAYVDKNVAAESSTPTGNFIRFPLQPLRDIHLGSRLKYELEPNGERAYVYLFSLIGSFILLLACVNFVNLATARSFRRSREVGIRKVAGSRRGQLFRQFLTEAFLSVALAAFVAIVLTELALPLVNSWAGKKLAADFLGSPFALAALAGLALLVTGLAGAYPALVLSSFRPVQALKGRIPAQGKREGLRQGLVVLQFGISIGLIVGTIVVRDQLDFIQNKRLGFDQGNVLMVHRAGALRNQFAAFRGRLLSHPSVIDASAAQNLPGQEFDSMGFSLEQPANYQQTSLTYGGIDEHYVSVLQLKIVAGRNFSADRASDASAFLINQAAAKAFGWEEPLGKRLGAGEAFQGPVIGVVEDFHFESLRHQVKPIVFFLHRWEPSYIAVRLRPGSTAGGLAAVQSLWKEFVPNTPLQFSFLDQDYRNLYDDERRVGNIFAAFSALAILIACLGLLGLASFMAEQRTKEIGVRKVLGATVLGLVGLLSRSFAKLVLASFIIASPLAYFAMKRWLRDFAYRTDPSWRVFAAAGGIALLIALLTVSYHALKAALADPVKAIRYE